MKPLDRHCYVCGAPDEVDRHHVLPCEYGGPKDGKTVDLCTRHHRLVHRAAECYYKTQEYTKNYYRLNPVERERALTLIKYIVHQKGQHESSGKALADDARNMVQISCTPEELMLFHSVKTTMGMRSLARCIKAVMIQQYEKQLGVNYAASGQSSLRKPSPADIGKLGRRTTVRDKKSK